MVLCFCCALDRFSEVWTIHEQRSWKDQHGEEAPVVPELLKLLVMHVALAWQRSDKEVVQAGVAVLQRMAADLPSAEAF